MSKNDSVSSMYERIPAVAALNNVPGFDPVKLLRKTVSSKTREPVLKLYLPYKKLWFRLLYPNGRIKLNRLRMTDQVAIYEAQVFLDRTDVEPISSFTACCTKEESPNGRYLQDAQDEATDEALTAAGFGLQFADISMTREQKRFGSEFPVDASVAAAAAPAMVQTPVKNTAATVPKQPAKTAAPKSVQAPAQKTPAPQQTTAARPNPAAVAAGQVRKQMPNPPAVNPAQKHAQPAMQPSANTPQRTVTAPVTQKATVPPVANPVMTANPAQPAVHIEQVIVPDKPVKVSAAQPVVTVEAPASVVQSTVTQNMPKAVEPKQVNEAQNAFAVLQGNFGKPAAPATTEAPAEVPTMQTVRNYNSQTPIEEIMKQMTVEEARNVRVESGTCVGMTLGEVADKRAPILRFYTGGGYKGKDNIFLAAAKIVQQSLELPKAG